MIPDGDTTLGSGLLPDRFWDKIMVDPGSGCWIWTGFTQYGYGRFSLCGTPRLAHRVSYEALIGPVPNVSRGLRGPRTHCPQGHEYNVANTMVGSDTQGKKCRVCHRIRQYARSHSE